MEYTPLGYRLSSESEIIQVFVITSAQFLPCSFVAGSGRVGFVVGAFVLPFLLPLRHLKVVVVADDDPGLHRVAERVLEQVQRLRR